METDRSEQEWIERCQRGDTEAFGFLVERYMRQAYFAALGFVGSHNDALDLSQDAFVRAFRAIGRFDPARRFYTWYYQILKNLCLNFLRNRRNRPAPSDVFCTSDDTESPREPRSPEPLPDEQLERAELRQRLWQALWNIDAEDRALIVARDMLDTSYETLAELMECPSGTVMSRLYYARRRLRDQMEKSA
jgi:RNA polymerase sigma-70 factor (ECF subfamily)